MASKRSNKTARVLNLIATPSEATPAEPEQPAAPAAPVEPQPTPEEPPKEKKRTSTNKPKKTSKAASAAPVSAEPTQESPAVVSEELPTAEQPQAAPVPTPQPVVPIVQTVREKEQQVSDDIKSGLLQALIEAEAPAQPSESPAAAESQTPVAEDTVMQEVEESPVTASEAMTASIPEPETDPTPVIPQAPAPEAISSADEPPAPAQPTVKMPQPEAPAEQIYTPTGEQDVEYTNVLQELAEETSVYYTTNMLHCQCQRCIADMKALALTNLPSKYVVLEKSKRAAYMSVYAARYEKELSVQMMRACVIINEHPHH